MTASSAPEREGDLLVDRLVEQFAEVALRDAAVLIDEEGGGEAERWVRVDDPVAFVERSALMPSPGRSAAFSHL